MCCRHKQFSSTTLFVLHAVPRYRIFTYFIVAVARNTYIPVFIHIPKDYMAKNKQIITKAVPLTGGNSTSQAQSADLQAHQDVIQILRRQTAPDDSEPNASVLHGNITLQRAFDNRDYHTITSVARQTRDPQAQAVILNRVVEDNDISIPTKAYIVEALVENPSIHPLVQLQIPTSEVFIVALRRLAGKPYLCPGMRRFMSGHVNGHPFYDIEVLSTLAKTQNTQ